jgi:hypothetical protein
MDGAGCIALKSAQFPVFLVRQYTTVSTQIGGMVSNLLNSLPE